MASITVALDGALPARNEDRLGDGVARRQLIDRALAGLEIDMGERVEVVDESAVAGRGEKAICHRAAAALTGRASAL